MVVSIIHSRHKPFIKKLNYYLLAQLPENHNYLKNISRTPTFRAKAFHGNLPCMGDNLIKPLRIKKFLGVMFDQHLSWDNLILTICFVELVLHFGNELKAILPSLAGNCCIMHLLNHY